MEGKKGGISRREFLRWSIVAGAGALTASCAPAATEPPAATEDLIVRVSQRYVALYEKLTGRMFQPAAYPAESRIVEVLNGFLPQRPSSARGRI